jgi:tetratricopeptide (TPR) repeat protein
MQFFSKNQHLFIPLMTALLCSPIDSFAQNIRISEVEIKLQEKYMEGVSKQLAGKPEAASILFQEVLDKNPKCDACAFQIARSQMIMGNAEKAMDNIKKAIALDAKNKWYKIFLADLYEKTGRDKESVLIYQGLVETLRFEEEIHYHYAYNLVRIGEPLKALKVFDGIEKQLGVQEELIKKKHTIYLALGDKKKAGFELKKLSDAYPSNLNYLHLLSEFYESVGQKADAEAVNKRILKLDSNDAKAGIADASNQRAAAGSDIEYLRGLKPLMAKPEGDIDVKIKELLPYLNKFVSKHDQTLGQTLQELSEIIKNAHPKEAKAYSLLGDILNNEGKSQEAIVQYKECLKRSKTVYSVWEQILYLYDEAGQYDDLLTTSEEAVDLFPNNPTPYYFNGVALQKKGKLTDAVGALEQAVLMSAKKPQVKLEALTELGIALSKAKQAAKATKAFDDALALSPKSNYVQMKRAYSLILQGGMIEEARTFAANALSNGGDSEARVLDIYGDILFKIGDVKGAVQSWTGAKSRGLKSALLDKKIAAKAVVE